MGSNTWSNYGRHIYLLKRIRNIGIVFLSILLIVVSIFVVFRVKNGVSNEKRELLNVWSDGDYNSAYEISKSLLIEKPVDFFLLTVNGFSAYQIGISQINNQNTLDYIDECIFSLRKALLHDSNDGRVCYVLGKAYGYKGSEYADLAVKYLEKARQLSYEAADIPEYLGLAYAAYGDYRSSVEAFSLAFSPDSQPSDNLLLSIARSYMEMQEYSIAISYLQHCVAVSPDSKSIFVSRLMLAEIYGALKDYAKAEEQYLSIINETGENAEVRFQLGELYNLQGDSTKARAEWRIAYRNDPAHAKARARLNI